METKQDYADGTILCFREGIARCEIMINNESIIVTLDANIFSGFNAYDPFRLRMIDRNGVRVPHAEPRELNESAKVKKLKESILNILDEMIDRNSEKHD